MMYCCNSGVVENGLSLIEGLVRFMLFVVVEFFGVWELLDWVIGFVDMWIVMIFVVFWLLLWSF